jgi:hypothetical protein
MKPPSLPQRALEMHRRTGASIDECLFACATQHAIEHPDLPVPAQSRLVEPRKPAGRMTGYDRGATG